jgi:hypothetical protein
MFAHATEIVTIACVGFLLGAGWMHELRRQPASVQPDEITEEEW